MATATTKPNPALAPLPFSNRIVPVNSAPEDFDPARDLPKGFLEFLAPLHAALTLRQRALNARWDYALAEAHAGKLPNYLPPSDDGGIPVRHAPELVQQLFDEELDRLLREKAKDNDPQMGATLREARGISEEMIRRGEFNPV